jgi:two-component system response regulator AtoC
MPHVLIVDDDSNSAQMLSALVASEGFSTAVAGSLREARQQLMLMPADAVLLDLRLPDGSGLDLFENVDLIGDAQVVLITGHASIDTSVQALRVGAADYLVKPVNIGQLKRVLGRLRQSDSVREQLVSLNESLQLSGSFGRLIGSSLPMRRVYQQIERVAPTAVSVLLVGESGTGKEVVAQTIHELSRRSNKGFLAVNCGAMSPQLIESELFGHEKGSFTGAMRQHHGHFERAHEGTLFLDEITEMPLELQVKLLRVLESGTFIRVGSEDPIETDVRIIAATNRNPLAAVRAGKLREDLYYRLDVFQIALPPLRDRKDDIELLSAAFLHSINDGDGPDRRFSPAALEQLRHYHWPGNVRELRNVVQRSAIMADDQEIDEVVLPEEESEMRVAGGSRALPGDDADACLRVRIGSSIAQVERQLILATLDRYDGSRERTAEVLGISLKTLYNRMREYGQGGEPGP